MQAEREERILVGACVVVEPPVGQDHLTIALVEWGPEPARSGSKNSLPLVCEVRHWLAEMSCKDWSVWMIGMAGSSPLVSPSTAHASH